MSKKRGSVSTTPELDDVVEFDSVEAMSPGLERKWKNKNISLALGWFVMTVGVASFPSVSGLGLRHPLHHPAGQSNIDLSPKEVIEEMLQSRVLRGDVAPTKRSVTMEYVSPQGDPIPTSIRLISPDVMNGYPVGAEGCAALTADIYNASAILANQVIKSNARSFDYTSYHRPSSNVRYARTGRSRKQAYMASDESASFDSGIDEDSYGTNVQETGVDEADLIKSDGKHVFTAYGDILVVWDAKTGEEVSRTNIPESKPLPWAEGGPDYASKRRARISGLLLDSISERLVVIATGYELNYRSDWPYQPTLSNKGGTRILIYDISSLPTDGSELSLISSEVMDGAYRSSRMIKSVAHIVRQSSVQSGFHFSNRLSRRREEYRFDTKEMYVAHATSNAKWLLQGFAHRLAEELQILSGGSDCSSVTKVALYASGDVDNQEGFPESFVSSGILNTYLQVSSFDIASPSNEGGLASKTLGTFFPSSNLEVYASEDALVVAGRGYHRDIWTRAWGQSTHFLSFKLHGEGQAPSGLAIGNVPGYLLNQFSMDEYNGYFRVATTQNARWECIPVDYWPSCRWEWTSESKSRLSVMKFPQEFGEMETTKVIDNLGPREEIKSARFFDDKAYIVTFRTTDPLYTINLTDPENPRVTDELKITGYSSYLHPVGDDRLLAIGKEANETTGRITGFQITLFDVSDLENTTVLQRYTIDQRWASSQAEDDHLAFRYLPESKLLILPVSIRSYSWMTKRVRPFDGFQVFYTSDEKIESRFNISMMDSSRMTRGCWYYAYLAPRSMVFKGNLTVVKGHGYSSYDLNTEQMRWKKNLDEKNDKCASYWG